ncbi:cytochrome P450 [Thozetella sp. PMI_491]|nr:cytochrome P450 [Thozetella sp. PMI_491]
MSWVILFIILGLAYAAMMAFDHIWDRLERDEPPRVYSRFPFLGHFIGLVWNGVSFFNKLRERSHLPILTISVLGRKVYVIHSPALISQVHRKPDVLSNNGPFMETVFARIMGIDPEGMALIKSNAEQRGSLRREMQEMDHFLLNPAEDSMKQAYCNTMSEIAQGLSGIGICGSVKVDLMKWLQRMLLRCTSIAMYGPNNPFEKKPTLLQDFWDYEAGLKSLTLDVYPEITALATVKARQRVVDNFKEFYEHPESQRVASLVQNRTAVSHRFGCSKDHVARFELGLLSGLLMNTVPALFWILGYITEDRLLLSRILDEIPSVIEKTETGALTIKISAIKSCCPILDSAYQETLRIAGSNISAMEVLEDTVLGGKWLLKKGAMVQIPAFAIHMDPGIWGPDAAEFDAERFIKKETNLSHSNFQSFGGGATLCPGRHLARAEILGVTVLMLFMFDVAFSDKTPKLPAKNVNNLGAIMKPKTKLELILTRKSGMEHVKWDFSQVLI